MLRSIKRCIRKAQTKSGKDSENKKEPDLNKELKKFYAKVKESRWHDNNFAREDDIDLSEEEINEIDKFWGKYSFAYPEIFYDSFKIFKNRYGEFDVRHCPGAIRWHYFRPHFTNKHYQMAHQNKGMYPLLYPGINKPRTIIRRMAGIYYGENYEPLSSSDAVEVILDSLKKGENIIIKPSGLGGGKKIRFLYSKENNDEEDVVEALKTVGNAAMVVQHVLEQSSFMKKFNITSLNTIRVTTMLWKGKVIPLGALIRIGSPGAKVDNYTQGGAVLGVDVKTGICNKWAMTHDLERVTVLPSGLVLDKSDLYVPNFDKIVESVIRMHYLTPYNKLISWDMALDRNDTPTMIENNFAGSLQLHEAVNGPLFGEYMEELMDTYMLKLFNVEFKTKDWIFKEYSDHIVVKEYLGKGNEVIVPEQMKGKPVTEIEKDAFKKCQNIAHIVIPNSVVCKCPKESSMAELV